MPAVEIAQRPLDLSAELRDSVDEFAAKATDTTGSKLDRYVFARILVALISQARRAHSLGVAKPADIDTALKYGTNYPKGPLEWAEQIGTATCDRLLSALDK